MATAAIRMFRTRLPKNFQHLRSCVRSGQQELSTDAKPIADTPEISDGIKIDPLKCPDMFMVHNLFTVKTLFDAKVHLGHRDTLLHDNMRRFIYGSRLGHLIIDLDQTAVLLRDALNFAAHIAYRKGIILFIAKHPQCTHMIEQTAKKCKEYSHTREWSLGTFTDSDKFFKAIVRLPDLCIFLNTFETVLEQHIAVIHAAKMTIPTIGIVDTNANPNLITYPVPGNDDSECAIKLYCDLFCEAILRGKQARARLENATMAPMRSQMSYK